MNLKQMIFACGLVLSATAPSHAVPIKLCNSSEFWPPYSYVKNNKMGGLHTEILNAAFADAGLDYELALLPWKRCQDRVAVGELDGIIGISYTDERGALYRFPAHAKDPNILTPPLPEQALSDVEFVVVTRADTPPPASISVAMLPEPVGVLLGYRSAGTITAAGKQVQIVAKQSSLFQMLERGRISSVVVLRGAATHYVAMSEQPLAIHAPALWSTPHYLAFSRQSGLEQADIERVWQAIKTVRQDKGLMARLQATVTTELIPCFNTMNSCN